MWKAVELLRLVLTTVRASNNVLVLYRLGKLPKDHVEGDQSGMQSTCVNLMAGEGRFYLALTS